jgi:uncharacterized protein YyaL (SSP411 family)
VFGDEGLRDFALRSLDRIVLDHYRPGSGVAHCVEQDAPVRGLLDDQVATATALLDAFDTTADVVYQMMAEELARQLIPAFHDEGGGGLFDRAPSESDVGLLKHRMKPFVGNCEAARMLSRLARACSEPAFNHLAEETLRAVAGHAGAQGPLAAHYVLALREASVR